MIKLRSLFFEQLVEANRAESVQQIRKWFYECMEKYFPEYKAKIGSELQEPKFEVRSIKSVGLYSSLKYKDGKVGDPKIILHPNFIDTDGRSTTFHETIHYIQSYYYNYNEFKRSVRIYGGHDAFFDSWMNKMNAVEGDGYIDVEATHDKYKDVKTVRKFWVYAYLADSGDLRVTHTKRFNEKIKVWLLRMKSNGNAEKVYMFETDEYKYQLGKISSGSVWVGVIENPDLDAIAKYELKENV
jgi:hypothetical protein